MSRRCPPSRGASEGSRRRASAPRWLELPQDVSILICQFAGPCCVDRLGCAGSAPRELARDGAVWRSFCLARWGRGANLHAYRGARELYLDRGGPRDERGAGPADEAPQLRLHDHSKNFADDELIAVSEAPRGSCTGARAGVLVVDCGTREVRQRMSVSDSRINCCDAAGGLVCLGGSDSKVRLLRRAEAPDGRGGTCGEDGAGYQEVWTHQCLSEVNDLRLAREGAVVTVRTGPDRCPAGMDLIPLDRPDALVSFQGGCSATMGKYIHALDGFEEGCSLSSVICAGEDAFTSAFSVMLFDFRRQSPGVVDLPVAALGQPPTSTVWPLRAGASHLAYAGMGRRGAGGGIAVVDFRYPTTSSGMQVCFPGELDDFRCFGGSLYAACTARGARGTEASVFRCSPSGPRELELLSSVVGAWPLSSSGQGALEDLKVLTVSQRGFALSCGEHLLLGSVAEAGRPGRLPPASSGGASPLPLRPGS
ncbi:unnamed protein product [Prorocentrum cordatum]|uniref:F-box domain-containing protein n=2 Tax=Prorocentrum cordatum TaxID=2364126 RepID=A0ABN9U994_9DINO|nr:unnamed protein product [Polarella glacialis]